MNWQSQFFVLIETSWNVKKSVDTVYVVSVSY